MDKKFHAKIIELIVWRSEKFVFCWFSRFVFIRNTSLHCSRCSSRQEKLISILVDIPHCPINRTMRKSSTSINFNYFISFLTGPRGRLIVAAGVLDDGPKKVPSTMGLSRSVRIRAISIHQRETGTGKWNSIGIFRCLSRQSEKFQDESNSLRRLRSERVVSSAFVPLQQRFFLRWDEKNSPEEKENRHKSWKFMQAMEIKMFILQVYEVIVSLTSPFSQTKIFLGEIALLRAGSRAEEKAMK